MLRRVQMYSAVWPLVIGLLVVAAWNNALVCKLCPQKTTNTSHCANKGAGTDSQHSVGHETTTVGTEHTEQCSHCVTHLPSQASSSRAVVFNNPSHGIVADDWCVVAVQFSPSTNLIDIHDHGPPGRSSPRYVLNNTFRI